jgi:hypothetical protein
LALLSLSKGPGDLVLLPDACFVGKPQLYWLAGGIALPDLRQARGKLFLKAAGAAGSWAWWRGRAESLR